MHRQTGIITINPFRLTLIQYVNKNNGEVYGKDGLKTKFQQSQSKLI